MKKRIITGIIIFLVSAPCILFGGYYFALYVLGILACSIYELLKVKGHIKKDKAKIIFGIILFLISFLLVFDLPIFSKYNFNYLIGTLDYFYLNPLIYIVLFVYLFGYATFSKDFTFNDAIFYIAMVIYVTLGLKGLLYLRSVNHNQGLFYVLFLISVTCLTDIFAYFGGMLFYKIKGESKVHKFAPVISPKKTIEGVICGTFIGSFISFLLAIIFKQNVLLFFCLSFTLSILGQLGDLFMSLLKRNYQIKDFSNILPGHGGILDRIDSLLLNAMFLGIVIFVL